MNNRGIEQDAGSDLSGKSARYARYSRRFGNMLACFLEEPIGIAVPLAALILFLFAPQMPDMFARLKIQHGELFRIDEHGEPLILRPFYLGLSAALLGFLAWYWTRAALMASEQMDDAARATHRQTRSGLLSPAEWSRIWTPRLALLLAGWIAASPLVVSLWTTGLSWQELPIATSVIGLVLVFLAFLITRYRLALGLAGGVPPLPFMWMMRVTSVLAAAPFSWPVALLILGVSYAGSLVIWVHPEWIDTYIDAPCAGLIALGLVIGPLVLALALLRDLIGWALWLPAVVLKRTLGIGEDNNHGLPGHATADVLGLLLLVVILILPSLVNPIIHWSPPDFYKIRLLGPLAEKRFGCAPDSALSSSVPAAQTPLARPTLEQALATFRDARLKAGYPHDKSMPVIIVAAEGGASRAAVWLLSTMQELDAHTDHAFGQQLFAISGVSGGSLGAVTYLQALAAYGQPAGGLDWGNKGKKIQPQIQTQRVQNGLNQLADADLLGASIATFFMNDSMGRLFGRYWYAPDRGIALEQTFERQWESPSGLAIRKEQAEGGLIALQQSRPNLPHLLLNGTDPESGKRVITSTMRFSRGNDLFAESDDFFGVVGHDIPAAAAVTNSARFPIISPQGRYRDDCRSPWQTKIKTHLIVDGGYFENYGARTAGELALKISQLAAKDGAGFENLVPIVVVVSNDADAYRTPQEARDNDGWTLSREAVTCIASWQGRPARRPDTKRDTQRIAAQRAAAAQAAAAATTSDQTDDESRPLGPLLTLYAAHGAYGRDALHILRRQLCPASRNTDLPRMFHIALPKPRPEKGEAAPLNWVLNKSAKQYLLGHEIFGLEFNKNQIDGLVDTLEDLRAPDISTAP